MIEHHPNLRHFDATKKWHYLIIGTFPPNAAVRSKMYVDYFYGNKGFLWKIIHDLYAEHGYDFFKGSMQDNLAEIKRWQQDYCVGLTDTILSCSRKHPSSSNDSDLVNIEYNHGLKEYILMNLDHIQKLIFTSTFGKNSAFENFKKIMGEDLHMMQTKLATGLPSPSGSSNITYFNYNDPATLGLTPDFFDFLISQRPDLLDHFKHRWQIKYERKKAGSKSGNLPAAPAGLVTEYKLYRYKQVLPAVKCR